MKAILEFNLPEEQYEHRIAAESMRILSAIRDLDEHLRKQLKYQQNSDEKAKVLQETRDFLYETGIMELAYE